jgi:alpha-tubulin suppressor-like RCC1 family protein
MSVTIDKSNSVTELQTLISGLTVASETTSDLVLILKTASLAGVDASSIKTELLSRISSANTSISIEEITLLSASLPLITENRSISVADMTALNALVVEAGTIVFVDSENIPYIRKSDSTWTLLFPSLQTGGPKPNAYAWGSNSYGKLGDNTTTNRSSPVSVVESFTDWIQIDAGSNHSLGVRANGTAWAWGSNGSGRLGDGTSISKSSPVSVVGGFTDWVQLSAGTRHSLGLRANGTAWGWGDNTRGSVGDGTNSYRRSPVSVVGGFTDWTQLSAGQYHSLGVRTNGTAWAWGSNERFKLGVNAATSTSFSSPVSVVGGFTDWTQVSAGSTHSLGLRANGTIWAWGSNIAGNLGDGTVTSRTSPVSVVGGFTDWTQVSAGGSHSLGLRANGTAWAWGANQDGELGNNSTISTSSPIPVLGGFTDWIQIGGGSGRSLGIRANGTAWVWGSNFIGRLGDGTTTYRSLPVSVAGGFTDWIQLSAGPDHSFVIRSI